MTIRDGRRVRRGPQQVAALMAGAVAVGVVLSSCTGTATEEQDGAPAVSQGDPTAAASASPVPVSAEEQAIADLEQLVRSYYAAENAVFLDPTSDPSAALDPYLRNPASAARVADVLSFRNAGHTLESRSAEVHSVLVTSLDLDSSPMTATLEECGTLAGSGWDADSSQQAAYTKRGLTIWSAATLSDGSWRLFEYENPKDRQC